MAEEQKAKKGGYIETVGRRKTSVARVRISESASEKVSVNEKEFAVYFPTKELQAAVVAPFRKAGITQKFSVTAKLSGGGISSQSEALRHGIARALVEFDPELRKTLKHVGFLKRDPRMKERRKFGLRKARRAPQWSKR